MEYKERKGRNGEREWQGVNGNSLKKMASVIMSIIEGRSKFRKRGNGERVRVGARKRNTMSRLQKEKSLLEVGKCRMGNDEAEMLRRECAMEKAELKIK